LLEVKYPLLKTKKFKDYESDFNGEKIIAFEPQEMTRAWRSVIPLCEKYNIPHSNGRPLVPWTPTIAKQLAPNLFNHIK